MGGGGQANKGQATQSFNSQQAASQQDMALSKQNQAEQAQLFSTLFGTGKPGSSGTLSPMLDPKSLNQTGLNPNFKTQFNEASDQIAQNYAGQRGSLAQAWANQGATSNSTPSGFQADQMRKLGNSEADTRGATYAGLKGQQYTDALSNFWNASNIASGNAATATGGALQGAGQSGSSSASTYGTAGAYHPGTMGNVVGSALGAAGAVGSGAMTCPVEGSKVLMSDGTRKLIEALRKGDMVIGADGKPDEVLEEPMQSVQDVVEVRSAGGSVRVSLTHTFIRHAGGYAFAGKCLGELIDTDNGPLTVLEVKPVREKLACRHLFLKRSHGYNVEGFWSLE